MAAYGAAVSLKNTITLILRSSRIWGVPTFPIVDHLAGLFYAVFDSNSYFKVAAAAYVAAVCLNYTVPSIQQLFPIWLVYVFHISYFKWVMMAYVAATYHSHRYKMRRILPGAFYAKFLVLVKAYYATCRLQKALLKLDETSCRRNRTKVNDLDERIKEAILEFEDLLESHVYQQILPQLEGHFSFSVDLQSLAQSVDLFFERVAVMEAEYGIELANMPEEEGELISSRIDFGGINSTMVGSSDLLEQVRDYLIKDEGNRLSVTGMAGVGKTTLAKKVFEDLSIQRHFELRAWVKVGRKCELNESLRCILAQVDPNTRNQMLTQGDEDDEKLVRLLKERLMHKKCLIVFDDVWEWDTRVMDKYLAEEKSESWLQAGSQLKNAEIML